MITRYSETKLKYDWKKHYIQLPCLILKLYWRGRIHVLLSFFWSFENIKTNTMKVFRVLSCVLYYITENHVFIEYFCCQSKKLSIICSDKIFTDMSYNELLSIRISEVSMNPLSWHGIMNKTNSSVILLCRTWLLEYYVEKGFVILLKTLRT